jgi:hypothetical protein
MTTAAMTTTLMTGIRRKSVSDGERAVAAGHVPYRVDLSCQKFIAHVGVRL